MFDVHVAGEDAEEEQQPEPVGPVDPADAWLLDLSDAALLKIVGQVRGGGGGLVVACLGPRAGGERAVAQMCAAGSASHK